MNELLTTTEAARIAGVGVTSIKRWTDQSLIRVTQTPGGHRRVLKSDLELFLAQSSNEKKARANTRAIRRVMPAIPNSASRWADIMLTSDVYTMQGALLEARGRMGSWHAASDEAIGGLMELGRRWETGLVTAIEEHVASENLTLSLAMLMTVIPRSWSHGATCLLACPEGETHTLGLSFLQLCLREAGWATIWVGAGVPTAELCATASAGEVEMIAMSASVVSQDASHLAQIASQVGAACALSGTKLVMGGTGAWPDAPAIGRRFNAFSPFNAYIASL